MLILAAPTGAVENHSVREFLAERRRGQFQAIRERLAAELTATSDDLDAIARFYTTVMQGLSIQARDGADRAELEAVITCAMAPWETLVGQ
jgi:uncharacterized protein